MLDAFLWLVNLMGRKEQSILQRHYWVIRSLRIFVSLLGKIAVKHASCAANVLLCNGGSSSEFQ